MPKNRPSFSGPDRWASLSYRRQGAYPDTLIAMPGSRARVLGCQLYVEQIKGISHWALNYYAAQSAGYPIDPYINTDCDGLAPAGDAHLLYPGQGGTPEESIRMMHFLQALQDLRALEALEKKAGREKVLEHVVNGQTLMKDVSDLQSQMQEMNSYIQFLKTGKPTDNENPQDLRQTGYMDKLREKALPTLD